MRYYFFSIAIVFGLVESSQAKSIDCLLADKDKNLSTETTAVSESDDQLLAEEIQLFGSICLRNTISNAEFRDVGLQGFLNLVYGEREDQQMILAQIEDDWSNGYFAPFFEIVRLSSDHWLLNKVDKILKDKSDGAITNYYKGLRWLWSTDYEPVAYYSDFKAELHKYIDPKFEGYFKGRSEPSTIRLDEVMWGGVVQDGIPPLRIPNMLAASDADYLKDDHVVFGFYINGIAKAYPKRILAWHEFFVDEFAETKIAGVYCTLCGTVIAYDMTHNNQFHDLGTSGFLYRSNKLMYDRATQSLWNTIEGKPVIGPLVGKGIELESYSVVTTTWGEWKKIHPKTTVLSLDTGHRRNYDEGEAYKDYYATDELMFPVPSNDDRLKNKAEVLVLKTENYQDDPIAISIDYLKRKGLFQDAINGMSYVVIAEKDGLSKAYESKDVIFKNFKNGMLVDSSGEHWQISEDRLTSPSGKYLNRLPSHNIFWFAWVNAFPDTELVY